QELRTHLHAYPPQRDGTHHVGRTRAQWGSDTGVRLYASEQPRGAIELCMIPQRASATSAAGTCGPAMLAVSSRITSPSGEWFGVASEPSRSGREARPRL